MVFQKPKKKVHTLTLKIDKIVIEQGKTFNFIGLNIDKTNLNSRRHTENISNACYKKICI